MVRNGSSALQTEENMPPLLVRIDDERSLDAEGSVYISHSGFHLLPGESYSVSATWKGAGDDRALSIRAINADKRIVK
jgi:hypothetical protein